jgi:transcriptional regulator with XRE-family HTH domain
MLLQVGGTLAAIAEHVGSTRQSVHEWRSGTKAPSKATRTRMAAELGIPARAWDELPFSEPEPPDPLDDDDEPEPQSRSHSRAVSTPPPRSSNGSVNSIEHVQGLLDEVAALRQRPNLLASERLKLVESESKLLAMRHKLELESQLRESRFVAEHPAWLQLRAALVRALIAHPAAAQVVADVLRDMRM